MSVVDVVSCVAAVVSGFHGGADLIQTIKERRDKERRKRRKDKDIEQSVAEKMLHKSLLDGAEQCKTACADRRQRFGEAFARGDAIATSELKDVMISLQTEIISPLQIARSLDNAQLDIESLHEAAITNKSNAIRAMDQLCTRIMTSYPAQGRLSIDREISPVSPDLRNPRYANRPHRSSEGQYKHPEEPVGSFTTTELPVGASQPGVAYLSSRTLTKVQSAPQAAEPAASAHQSKRSVGSLSEWMSHVKLQQTNMPNSQVDRLDEEDEDPSIHDSAVVENGYGHRPSVSVTSTRMSDAEQAAVESATGAYHDLAKEIAYNDRVDSSGSDVGSGRTGSSNTFSPRTTRTVLPRFAFETEEAAMRAHSAPEVVTKEYESRLIQQQQQQLRQQDPRPQPEPPTSLRRDQLSAIHPAFRRTYTTQPQPQPPSPGVLDPEPDQLWSPLARPAKINNYHNFCKGAWDSRRNLHSGLAIAMIPNYKGNVVAHWKCKQCEFRSKGLNNSNLLPDQIYFAPAGVRYRWLFLAKSHVPARQAHPSKSEIYRYGCVFCAAQGRETPVLENLDRLMEHILGKHKTAMITPEVLAKTKCVVGGTPGREEEWDINLPEMGRKQIASSVQEFVVSAVTGIL